MKRLILLAALLAGMTIAKASQVNEQEACRKAVSFFANHSKTRGTQVGLSRVCLSLDMASAVESVNDAPLYAFNLDGGGYVIVSGDDRTAEILAFSEKGHLNMDHMPSNMKRWLEGYVKKIQNLPANVMPRQQMTRAASYKEDILPKLKTAWGQYFPYNLHAPELHVVYEDIDLTSQAVTGCIATAMAQVMNYRRYPDKTLQTVESYSGTAEVPEEFWGDDKVDDKVVVDWETEAVPAGTKIDWDHITDTYNATSTEKEKEAVSRLMQYCGVASNMQYGWESYAGTDEMVYALYDVFGYEDVYMLHQMNYDAQGWADVLYDVISKEGPLLFGGDCPDDEGGHQFILDGYRNVDGKDYFYANWGWNGEDDGYVLLDVMSPGWIFDDFGRELGFTEYQMATPGLGENGKGKTSIEKNLYCSFFEFGTNGEVYERMSKDEGFDVEYAFYFLNLDHPHSSYQMGIGFFQDDRFVQGFNFTYNDSVDLPLFYYWGGESESAYDVITLGDGMGDGVYQIKMMCATAGEDDWKVCRDEEDVNLVTMTIKGNKATFSSHVPPTGIQTVTKDDHQTNAQNANWHTLSGVRLNGAPSAKGIYIHNGKKIVIK